MSKKQAMTPGKNEESDKKVADQIYWVNKIKENPDDFGHYLQNKVLKKQAHKDIVNNVFSSTHVDTIHGRRKNSRPYSAYPIKNKKTSLGNSISDI